MKFGVQILSPFLLPLSFQSCGLAPGQCLTIMKTSLFKGVPPVSHLFFFFFNYDLQEGELH